MRPNEAAKAAQRSVGAPAPVQSGHFMSIQRLYRQGAKSPRSCPASPLAPAPGMHVGVPSRPEMCIGELVPWSVDLGRVACVQATLPGEGRSLARWYVAG